MEWLRRSWSGGEELGKLVWVYGALFIVIGQAVRIALRIFTDISIDSPESAIGKSLSLLEVLYCIWMLVSLWRCAFNAFWSGWGYIARFIVILCVLFYCALSYMQQRVLLPEEAVATSETLLQSGVTEWQNGNNMLAPAKPAEKKKPAFMIKVHRI